MPDLYIPPKEISFRLRACHTGFVIFSRADSKKPSFSHFAGPTVSDDQWWHLVPGSGSHEGLYAVQSNYTKRVIYSRASSSPRIGHTEGDKYPDTWFKLEAGTGNNANYFRLRCLYSNMVLYSRTKPEPAFYNISADSQIYDDQFFTFDFEDMKYDRIEFKVDQGRILSSVPVVIGQESERNETNINQAVEFDFSKTLTKSSSFERTHGFTLGASLSIESGIPFITKGKIQLDASMSHTWKIGRTDTKSETYTLKYAVTAPPHTKVTGTGSITSCKIEIPFTVYSKSVATGFEAATYGTYRGVTFWNIESTTKEEKI